MRVVRSDRITGSDTRRDESRRESSRERERERREHARVAPSQLQKASEAKILCSSSKFILIPFGIIPYFLGVRRKMHRALLNQAQCRYKDPDNNVKGALFSSSIERKRPSSDMGFEYNFIGFRLYREADTWRNPKTCSYLKGRAGWS